MAVTAVSSMPAACAGSIAEYLRGALFGLRDLFIPSLHSAPLPPASPSPSAAAACARAAVHRAAHALHFPALYARHPSPFQYALACLIGAALFCALLALRALLACLVRGVGTATGSAALIELAEEQEGLGGIDEELPENPFWAGTFARRREKEEGKGE